MKAFPTEALTHTPISAVLDLIKEHDIAADEIAKVHIRTTARGADILSDASKYDPHTKETADHSLPYVIAAAIAERQVTPLQFTPAKINDPLIRAQLSKIVVTADPGIEDLFPALQRVIVHIHAVDGREFTRQLDYPKGDARNPLTNAEVEEKFEALAEPVMSAEARRRAIDAIWELDAHPSVTGLMKLFAADRKSAGGQ
jgi:2-methylcitrate dehydratase